MSTLVALLIGAVGGATIMIFVLAMMAAGYEDEQRELGTSRGMQTTYRAPTPPPTEPKK